MEFTDESLALLFTWLIVALICGVIGGMCGGNRGRGAAGFFLGFMLGPLGIVLALFLPEGAKLPVERPGAPVSRARRMPVKPDPIEEFEARERARMAFQQVPEHLRGKNVGDES